MRKKLVRDTANAAKPEHLRFNLLSELCFLFDWLASGSYKWHPFLFSFEARGGTKVEDLIDDGFR